MSPARGHSRSSLETVDVRRSAGWRGVQTVLIFGFLLTAGTWVFAGSFFGREMREVQEAATEIGRRYLQAQALLSDTRGEVYRASIFVRDALLDPEPDPGRYVEDVERAYRRADELLSRYEPVLGSTFEHERVARLRLSISELRDANLGVLSTDSRTWRNQASELLISRIMPKREAAILVAGELQSLNRSAYVDQQELTANLYRDIQYRFWRAFGLAVFVTLGIAVVSAVHVHRLERRLRLEQEKDALTALELQSLSAKLVGAQEDERRTIARELHDEIGQVLTVIKMELAHAQRHIVSLGGSREYLDEAREITDRALTAVRDISQFLHPSVLDDLGLAAAVDWYVQRINTRQDLRVEFRAHDMGARLPAEIEVALYRIVQEGVTNVLRHAQARLCRVELARDDTQGVVRLTIEDDGVGFDPLASRDPHAGRGLGLIGMRERVTQLGGTLVLDSAAGAGCRLSVKLSSVHDRPPAIAGTGLAAGRAPLRPSA